MSEKKLIRVQKLIAMSGFASRRKAEALIEAGSVKVNCWSIIIISDGVSMNAVTAQSCIART